MTQQPTVKAVGFCFLSPAALSIILRGYNVSMYMGDAPPRLVDHKPNVVIVPNLSRRNDLAPVADRIHRVLLYSGGAKGPLEQLGITPLDVEDTDEGFQPLGKRTPSDYIEQIEKDAVEITLDLVQPLPEKTAAQDPDPSAFGSIDQYMQYFEKALTISNFDRELEYPIAWWVAGDASNVDLRGALQALAAKQPEDAKDKAAAVLRTFYGWLKDHYGPKIKQAVGHYVRPNGSQVPTEQQAAQRYNVAVVDIQQVVAVYRELQEQING